MRLSQWQTFPLFCLTSFLLRSPFAISSAATSLPNCSPPNSIPINYPIRNVTLSDGTLRRGVAVSIGTPAQPFAFQISPKYNNTYLNDGVVPGCVNNTVLYCSNQYGGLFDEGTSTTWSPGNLTAIGTAGEYGSDQDNDTGGSDTLLINTTLSIPDFPLGIFRGSTTDQENTLGLGRNSTLLSALVSAGAIFSRTFSLFQGWTGAQTQYQTDGSLVLGGYDSAKITGNNITLPFTVDDSCIGGLIISVTDINMNLRNGSNISIIGQSQGSAMRACIEPSYSPLTLSDEIWWAFTNVTGVAEIGRSVSPVSNFWGMMIPANGSYDGDLTFSIYPGLDITIPNHQLVVPEVEIDSEGQEYLSSSTEVEVLINSLQSINANDLPLFGLPFLSSAYLMVDYDKQQFTLSQSKQSTTSNLIANGPPACNTPTSSPTPQSLPSILASPTSTPNTSSSTPTGAIAGAVVGGLAIIALCIGVPFILKKRRAKRLAGTQQGYGAMAAAVKMPTYSDNEGYIKSEMPADNQPPQELPLDRDSGQGLAPYELPAALRDSSSAL